MRVLKGKGVFDAVAIGPLHFYDMGTERPADSLPAGAGEAARLAAAMARAKEELDGLYAHARQTVGEQEAQIFEIHRMMLEDGDLAELLEQALARGLSAADAAEWACGRLAEMLRALDDDYMRARAADVEDICGRLKAILTGRGGPAPWKGSVILAAKDLTPSQTVTLEKDSVLGFATVQGAVNSHTAILARTMGLPAAVQLGPELCAEYEGCMAALDGGTGELFLEPSEPVLARLREKQAFQAREKKKMDARKHTPAVGPNGRRIHLYANVGCVEDVRRAIAQGAEGVGLFRSEFLYIGRSQPPSEEEQYQAYRQALELLGERPMILRTLDIGADKQAAYLGMEPEQNPAMGLRAVRLCLRNPRLFHTQLRAAYRAAAHGRLQIMFPMVVSAQEVAACLQAARRAREELEKEGLRLGGVPLGIMIETPAAAVMSDELAREVDFFSIGTNDLTQYTLAADRQNAALDDAVFCASNPAVLRLISRTVENAHRAGIWVGICGELAADTALTDTFVEMGVDELSAAPARLPALRSAVLASCEAVRK